MVGLNRRNLLAGVGAGFAAGFTAWPGQAQPGDRAPLGYLRTNWSKDPLSFGSYSFIARGASGRDSRRLEKPLAGRLFFAGEAVNPKRSSTVHAAYESGQRTAGFVLDKEARRVAIIGAGMSGLSAAHKLAGEGVAVTVFEARNRIGGRIWTDNRLGAPVDLGASWIHGVNGNPLVPLAEGAGQAMVPTSETYIIRGRDGRQIDDADAPEWLDEVSSVQISAGASSSELNNLAYLFRRDYGGDEVIFPGGYSEVFTSLGGDYEVRFETPVNRIAWSEDSATVSTQSGDESYDAVIVTVPLGVLKNGSIDFDPALPEEKIEAIDRLGMGLLDKVYLQFEEAFWDKDIDWITTPENGLAPGQLNSWLNLHKYIGAPIILAFNGGPPARAMAEWSDDKIISAAVRTLNAAYPV